MGAPANRFPADAADERALARSLLAQTATGVAVIAFDGCHLAVNATLCGLLGRSEEELLRMTWRDVTHPDDRGAGERLLAALRRGGEREQHSERRYVRPDGADRWAMVGTSLVHDAAGRPVAYLSQVIDVTDRRRAEEALRDSERRLSETQALAELGSWSWDLETGAVAWSGQTFRLLGRKPDSVAPSFEWFMAHVHEDDRERVAEHIEHTLVSGERLDVAFRLVCADGRTRWVLGGGQLVRSVDGRPGHLVGYVQDVTARAVAQAALERSEEQVHLILATSSDAFVAYDRGWRVAEWNRAAAELFGWSRAEAVGRRIDELIVPPGATGAPLVEVLTSLESPALDTAVESTARHRDGGLLAVEVTIPRTPDRVLRSTFIRDISERKRVEAALRATNEALRDTVAALERRSRDVAVLAEMIDLLQSASEAAEGFRVIARYAGQLFPDSAGRVYVDTGQGGAFQAVAGWGGSQPAEPSVVRDDCWALRRGRLHRAAPGVAPLYCRHARDASDTAVCVPMIVQGETVGLVHARSSPAGAGPDSDHLDLLLADFAERTALALANMRLRERLHAQSIRDPLTGVFNRRYLEETFERELARARRNGYPLGVAMIDLDRFKQFNDRFGHQSGDSALQAFARFLQRGVRADDVVCRYGGEEFVVLFPGAGLERVRERCESLRIGAAALALPPTEGWETTVSVGVAAYPAHGDDSAALLKAADAALYEAKRSGRDRVVVSQAA